MGVYLALSVLLWQRIGWATKAGLSLLVLLGLLAATVWMPDGLEHGVMMLRQPTPIVLSAVTAAAVLFTFIIFVSWKFIPIWVSIMIGLLAAYGIAAFVLGIIQGTPYPALFGGNSLWERVPFWLQGAYIGALLLVPAALLYQIVNGIIRVRGRAFRGWMVQVVPLIAILLIAVAGIRGINEFPPSQLSQSSISPSTAKPQVTNLVVTLDKTGKQPVVTVPDSTQSIYALWTIKGVSSEVKVEGRCIAESVEGIAPGTVLSTSEEVTGQETSGSFLFTPPERLWKPGKYRIEVKVADGVSKDAEFMIAVSTTTPVPVEPVADNKPMAPKLDAVLARGVTVDNEPSSPTEEFPEDAGEIYLVVKSNLEESASITSNWIAVNVDGYAPNQRLNHYGHLRLKPGERGVLKLDPPKGGFFPGSYRVDLILKNEPIQSLSFKVVPILPPAKLVKQEEDLPRGFNIALAALGGKIENVTSEYDDGDSAVTNLIDGTPLAWSSKDDTVPQEIVFSFYQGREALVTASIIDTKTLGTGGTINQADDIPKHVEVWTSTTSATDGFTRVAGARIQSRPAEQVIAFSPTRAKYVKLRFLSNYGGTNTQAGEVKIIEAQQEGYQSILKFKEGPNIALPLHGGRPDSYWLTDGRDGLCLLFGSFHTFVFSFVDEKKAWINRIVIFPNPYGGLPRQVEISVSQDSPTEGFNLVKKTTLQDKASPQEILFTPVEARFLKLDPDDPYPVKKELVAYEGSKEYYASICEVEVYEALDEHPSILEGTHYAENIANPLNGGAVVSFSSQMATTRLWFSYSLDDMDHSVMRLTDNSVTTSGWASDPSAKSPHDIVFAFRDNQRARLEKIILHPKTNDDPSTWVKEFKISVSKEELSDGDFKEVELRRLGVDGKDEVLSLTNEPKEQVFLVEPPVEARFLKLRILSNYGGPYTSLGEITVTGKLLGAEDAEEEIGIATEEKGDLDQEVERNDSPEAANPMKLGRKLRGTIDPAGDVDYFRLDLQGAKYGMLNLDFSGKPHIKTSLTLLDDLSRERKRFDSEAALSEVQLTWKVEEGRYFLKVEERPTWIILIFDSSDSMKDKFADLEAALKDFVSQVKPTEKIMLMRFGNQVEVLSDFTNDREQLMVALEGKLQGLGETSLYDAISAGIEKLKSFRGNRGIVVLTDGLDSRSQTPYSVLWEQIQEHRIRLYTIGIGSDLKFYNPAIGSTGVRMMENFSLATDGKSFFELTSAELKDLYSKISAEVRGSQIYDLTAHLSQGEGKLNVVAIGERIEAVSSPSQVELILDASGSMKRKIDGRMMIDIAKEVMEQVIESLPEDVKVALRVYGHRIREGRKGDCEDSELIFPFSKIDKPKLLKLVSGIKALGTTPIGYSLQQVASDFGNAQGEKLIILVTDGKGECEGKLSDVVSGLTAKGFKVRLNIVGFALSDEETKQEMTRIAELTDGNFFDAKDSESLREAIEQSLAVPYDVLDASETVVDSGLTGQGDIELPEGTYTVVVHAAGEPITISDVRIAYNGSTRIEIKKEGQEIGTRVIGP